MLVPVSTSSPDLQSMVTGAVASPGKPDRLVALKTHWDPGNVLRFNHTILPAAVEPTELPDSPASA